MEQVAQDEHKAARDRLCIDQVLQLDLFALVEVPLNHLGQLLDQDLQPRVKEHRKQRSGNVQALVAKMVPTP